MITITYWDLNPDFDPSELAGIAQKLISKGVYPPKGEKTMAQYISAGDYWGVTISEVENEEVAATSANMWRIAKPGLFKVFKETIAMKLTDVLPIALKLAKQIKGK